MRSLWDFIEPVVAALRGQGRAPRKVNRRLRPSTPTPSGAVDKSVIETSATGARRGERRPSLARDRYETLVRTHLAEYQVKVRRWRRSMSGIAYELRYRDGSVKRMIEAPQPRGPMSAAIFLHEIGHHAIGFNRYKPRCLEEFHAWSWALAAMERHGIRVTEQVQRRVHASLYYAIAKAMRRGIKDLPPELQPYTIRPVPRGPSARSRQSVRIGR